MSDLQVNRLRNLADKMENGDEISENDFLGALMAIRSQFTGVLVKRAPFSVERCGFSVAERQIIAAEHTLLRTRDNQADADILAEIERRKERHSALRASARRVLTVELAETASGPSLEDQISDILADLTARRFRPADIQVPGDRDGYVYIGSEYWGTIRRTAMSDRFRFTADRGMNETGSGTWNRH